MSRLTGPALVVLLACVPPLRAQETWQLKHLNFGAGDLPDLVTDLDLSRDGRVIAYCTREPSSILGDSGDYADIVVVPLDGSAPIQLGSATPAGAPGSGDSTRCALSADGRWLVFTSHADDLVTGDANGRQDVFLRDLWQGTTELVSVASDGGQADRPCDIAATGRVVSDDGRFVVFHSRATQLVPGDGNWDEDVFVRDRLLGLTLCASATPAGVPGDGESLEGVLSADGTRVAFSSRASDLVPGVPGGVHRVYVRDLAGGSTSHASLAADGSLPGCAWGCFVRDISADGRLVLFDTDCALSAEDVDVVSDAWLRDLAAGTTSLVSPPAPELAALLDLGEGPVGAVGLSDDGRRVALRGSSAWLVPGDGNGLADAFVHDREEGTTVRSSLDAASGQLGDGGVDVACLSPDGLVLGFTAAGDLGTWNGGEEQAGLYLRDSRAWLDLGHSHGLLGPDVPLLHGAGDLGAGSQAQLTLDATWNPGPAWLVVGFDRADLPLSGGLLVPNPDLVLLIPQAFFGFETWAGVPDGVPAGTQFHAQAWLPDAWEAGGWLATNAVRGTTP